MARAVQESLDAWQKSRATHNDGLDLLDEGLEKVESKVESMEVEYRNPRVVDDDDSNSPGKMKIYDLADLEQGRDTRLLVKEATFPGPASGLQHVKTSELKIQVSPARLPGPAKSSPSNKILSPLRLKLPQSPKNNLKSNRVVGWY